MASTPRCADSRGRADAGWRGPARPRRAHASPLPRRRGAVCADKGARLRTAPPGSPLRPSRGFALPRRFVTEPVTRAVLRRASPPCARVSRGDHVWRGSAPGDEGYRALASMGIRTIVDLRAEHRSTRGALARVAVRGAFALASRRVDGGGRCRQGEMRGRLLGLCPMVIRHLARAAARSSVRSLERTMRRVTGCMHGVIDVPCL
ncbi:fused DSP-PTPase phosphatase/NAD kinase-like protein [Yinghuangia sp. ASG 101]|uniref:fused DSP-PTPase phosphatase/NAD kinase-like protein n=1 Tax=Yinghuangia sp. ASG 101 TaxID=2896848 RepID=UPI003FCE3C4E